MKLRIRSLESKETLKIQIPSPSFLEELKFAISKKISSLPHQSIHLSLNRKDELQAPPHESLQTLGVTSGDLIFYTLNRNGFSPRVQFHENQTQAISQNPRKSPDNRQEIPQSHAGKTLQTLENQKDCHLDGETSQTHVQNRMQVKPNSEDEKVSDFVDEEAEDMDVDEPLVMNSFCSIPNSLNRVLKEEGDNVKGDTRKLLVIAVHAVLLETGFVCLNPSDWTVIDGVGLPEKWASAAMARFHYTVNDLVNSDGKVVESVVLKFQTLGGRVIAYGSLNGKGSDSYGLPLNSSRFASSIDFMWKNADSLDTYKETHEREIFEFWKIVKDGLSLPLMIGLCEKTVLTPPPCFMRLPTDLKIKVLEFLPGTDIAKTTCVCLELKYLSLNDNLWKQKYVEEFGQLDGEGGRQGSRWKEKFVIAYLNAKRKRTWARRQYSSQWRYFPRRGPVPPFGGPRIPVRGGDHDLFPGGLLPFGSGVELSRPARQHISPHCNLGGWV